MLSRPRRSQADMTILLLLVGSGHSQLALAGQHGATDRRIGMSINRVDICLSRGPEHPVLISGLVLSGRARRRLRAVISPHTVNTCLRQVFAELGVPDRIALAAVVHHSIE
jgi:hypothetical protein